MFTAGTNFWQRRCSARVINYSKGRRKIQVAARSLLCYWAVRELGLTATGLAERLGMTQPAVNYSFSRRE